MAYVLKQVVLGAAVLVLLSGCANNPLMQTRTASSTETAQAIEESLDDALENAPESQRQAPDDVTDALMPEMGATGGSSMEEAFNVDARKLPASTFFQSLVEGTDYNAVVHPEVSGSISLELDQVTVPEVMDLVSDMYGFHIERQNNIFRIQPGSVQTRVFQIDYLDIKRRGSSETQVRSGQVTNTNGGDNGVSDDNNGGGGAVVGTRITTQSESTFWADLNESLNMIIGSGQGQKVITTPGSGVVVVQATPDELATVEDYLRRMQLISKRQVILEARILEVELEKGYQQGINWSYIDDEVMTGPDTALQSALSSGNVTSQEIGGVFSSALEIGDFSTLIELLGRQGNVQVLSSPRISTVNNEKAVIKVGSDEFFVTDLDFDDSTTATSQTSRSTSVDLTPFFSGISLDVTPQISENNVVTLHVHPAVSEVQDQEKLITIGDEDVTLPLALSTVRETDSVVSARSGEIVVIGGLMQENTEETTSAVPFFSEIPVIGELFKQRRFESSKSELVILLKPMVADAEQWQKDIEGSRERMRELRRIMESTEAPGPEPAASRQRQR